MAASKKDPAFRTKTKASSSAEAASLLSAGGFVGFDSAFGGDTQQQALSPEYQLAFKKLGKKDTITKLKGLHELEALFPTLDDAAKPAVLERWVLAFNSIGLDNDRQVREALHRTFSILIDRVKKDLALHLKSMITVWLLNQHDTYREVRSAAQTSFKAAIPKKAAEALLFCKQEILTQLAEYLAHTPQTLTSSAPGDVKAVGEAEATDRWERVISASISTVEYLIDQIPPAELAKLEPGLPALLDAKFWKFLTSRSALVRRAAYQLVATASLKANALIAPHAKALAPSIIGAFGDKEAVTHAAMWPALLCFLKGAPHRPLDNQFSTWEEVNVRKAIWPRLWAFLNGGCYGSASVSYPSLLPFMQLIPASVLGDKPSEFYSQLLSSLWNSLGADGSLTQVDAASALKAFSEVTLYASITLMKGGAAAEAEAVLNGAFSAAVVAWLTAPMQRVPSAAFVTCVTDVVGKLRGRSEAFASLLNGCFARWQALFEALNEEAIAEATPRWNDLLSAVLAPPQPPAAAAPTAATDAAAQPATELPVVPVASPTPALLSLQASVATRALSISRTKGTAAPLALITRIASSARLAAASPDFYCKQLLPAISDLISRGPLSAEMQSGLRALLKAHLTSLPAQANADDFAALLASISSIPSSLQVQFVAPLLQDVAVSASPALDRLCVSATGLSDSAVASMATVIAKGALSQDAVAQLADKLRTVAPSDAAAAALAAALVPHLPPASVSQLLHPLLSNRLSDDATIAAAAKSLWSAATLARLTPETLTSLAAAAEAAFPAQLRKASAATLADQASFILQLRSLALPQAAAQELLLRQCGAEAEWASVAQVATVSVKGIDYIRLGASTPIAPAAAPSLPFAECATRAHFAVLLLQRGLLQHTPVAEPARAAALLACVSLFAVLVRSQEARAENNLAGIKPEDLTDASMLSLATPAQWATAHPVAYAWATMTGGALTAACVLLAKLAGSPLSPAPAAESALASNSATDTLAALLRANALGEFAGVLAKQALSAVLSAVPDKPLDVATFQRGAEILSAYYSVQAEADMRLLSLLTQHQSLLPRLSAVDAEPRLHASLAALHTAAAGRLSNSAMLPSQLEFLLARVVDYLRCTNASEAGMLLRYRALGLLSAIHAYVARWTAQPLAAAAGLQKDASAGIVRQVCLVAATPVHGSVCSLATALEGAVLADRLLGMDIETPEGLYSALLSSNPSVQRAAYVILARGSVKQAETLLARAKAAPAKEAEAQGTQSEKVEIEKHEETLLPESLKKVLQSDKLVSVLSAADAEHQHASPEAIGFVLAWSALLDILQNSQLRSKITPYLRETRLTARFMSLLFAYIDVNPASAPKTLQRNHVEVLGAIQTDVDSLSDACALLLLRSLRILPALVRGWWSDDCDRSAAQQIEKYCTKYISPLLIDVEIAQVQEAKKEASCVIKGSRSIQEVSAAYEKDELVIEIVVKLPPSYPLRNVEVDSPRRKGMTEALWRKWLLSMTTLLITQDASILDAILLWKRSLDSHFDGVECCPICYAVFHASNYSLPRLQCKTCKNKFHHACMYKWFQTSHKSTCPLCQTPFSFDKNL